MQTRTCTACPSNSGTYFMNSSRLELTSSLDRSSPYQGSPNRAEPIPRTWSDGQFDDPSSWCLLYLWFFDNFSCKCFCSYRDIFTEINCYTAIVICTAVTRDPRTASSPDRSVRDSGIDSLVRRSLTVIVFSWMIFVESGFTVAECWNLCHQK